MAARVGARASASTSAGVRLVNTLKYQRNHGVQSAWQAYGTGCGRGEVDHLGRIGGLAGV